MSAKLSHLAVAGIVAPILRTLQAGERIVRRNEAGELVTLDLAEIARRVGAATGHTIAVARKRPVKVVGADGTVVKELTADEFLAKMLSRHFGVEVTPPKAGAKATLFWCACGKVEPSRRSGLKKYCKECKRSTDIAKIKRVRSADPDKHNAKRRALRAANPEKVNAKRRAIYAANPEKVNAKQRALRAADPEKVKAKQRALRAATRERVLDRKRAYRAANIEAIRAQQRARYAAKK